MTIRAQVKRFLEPRAIIFGVAVVFFVVHVCFFYQVLEMMHDYESRGFFPGSGASGSELLFPFLLLLAAGGLLLNRFWTYGFSLLAAGWIILYLGIGSLTSYLNAFNVPLSHSGTWFLRMVRNETWLFLHLVLATVIATYASVLLLRGIPALVRRLKTSTS